jgi:preprotein translocase subunit SecG
LKGTEKILRKLQAWVIEFFVFISIAFFIFRKIGDSHNMEKK